MGPASALLPPLSHPLLSHDFSDLPADAAASSSASTSTSLFHGALSIDLVDSASRLRRSGFCGMRTRPLPPGRCLGLADLDQLVLRVRGDGRVYVASLRTEHAFAGPHEREDVWAAFLFAPKGIWAEVVLPMRRFLLTVNGRVASQSPDVNPARVVGVGLALAVEPGGEQPGPFCLELDWIKAGVADRGRYRAPQKLDQVGRGGVNVNTTRG